jgi:hypothetical protein
MAHAFVVVYAARLSIRPSGRYPSAAFVRPPADSACRHWGEMWAATVVGATPPPYRRVPGFTTILSDSALAHQDPEQ